MNEIGTEYSQAREMINRGCLLALDHSLRESLGYVAQAVQEALNDGAVLTRDDVAILCTDEVLKRLKSKPRYSQKDIANYAYTLFYFSRI